MFDLVTSLKALLQKDTQTVKQVRNARNFKDMSRSTVFIQEVLMKTSSPQVQSEIRFMPLDLSSYHDGWAASILLMDHFLSSPLLITAVS